jgi:hypothetical protein
MGEQSRMRCSRITIRVYQGIGFRNDSAKRGQRNGRRIPKRRAKSCKVQIWWCLAGDWAATGRAVLFEFFIVDIQKI